MSLNTLNTPLNTCLNTSKPLKSWRLNTLNTFPFGKSPNVCVRITHPNRYSGYSGYSEGRKELGFRLNTPLNTCLPLYSGANPQ